MITADGLTNAQVALLAAVQCGDQALNTSSVRYRADDFLKWLNENS